MNVKMKLDSTWSKETIMKVKHPQKSNTLHRFFQRKPVTFHAAADRGELGHSALIELTARDPGQLAIALTNTHSTMQPRSSGVYNRVWQ